LEKEVVEDSVHVEEEEEKAVLCTSQVVLLYNVLFLLESFSFPPHFSFFHHITTYIPHFYTHSTLLLFTSFATTTNKQTNKYQPPFFAFVASIIDKTTGAGNSSLLAFVNGNREEQVEYVQDMLGIGIFFICIVCIWCFTLLLLKCSGKERMGCASGHAFHHHVVDVRRNNNNKDEDDEEDSIFQERPKSSRKHQQKQKQPGNSSSFLGFFSTNINKKPSSSSSKTKTPMPDVDYDSDGSPIFSQANIEAYSEPVPPFFHPNMMKKSPSPNKATKQRQQQQYHYYNHQPNVLYSIPKSNHDNDNDNCGCCCSDSPSRVQTRKFRTRCVYGFFALVSLVCSALLMTQMYYPLEASADTTAAVVQDTQVVVQEVDDVLISLRETATVVQSIYDTTPLNYPQLCPDVSAETFNALFGFDPQSVIDTIKDEYASQINAAIALLNDAQAISDTVASMLGDMDTSLSNTKDNLWVIPLLIFFSMLVTFALGGLMCAVAYKEHKNDNDDIPTTESPPALENIFGWTFLPLQIIVVLVSWGLVIACCFGTLVTTDSCMPTILLSDGSSAVIGTPEDTVVAVLSTYTPESVDDATVQRLETYIEGCQGEDPLAELESLRALLAESLAYVDSNFDIAQTIGIDNLEAACGEGNSVRVFFENIDLLQNQFGRINGTLTATETALACPRLNQLYVRATHVALCTEFASANAGGFVLFLVVSFSGLILISLRAAWRSSSSSQLN
jgi:hypothetical protein